MGLYTKNVMNVYLLELYIFMIYAYIHTYIKLYIYTHICIYTREARMAVKVNMSCSGIIYEL